MVLKTFTLNCRFDCLVFQCASDFLQCIERFYIKFGADGGRPPAPLDAVEIVDLFRRLSRGFVAPFVAVSERVSPLPDCRLSSEAGSVSYGLLGQRSAGSQPLGALVSGGHLIPGAPVKNPTGCLLVRSAPLLEVERYGLV